MNYLDNKYFDSFVKKRDLEIELAYSVYEKIIFEYLPKLIEQALKDHEKIVDVSLDIQNIRESFSGKIADIYIFYPSNPLYLGTVNLEELLNYFYQISNKCNKEHNIVLWDVPPFHYQLRASVLDFMNFYYEELQREQYTLKMDNINYFDDYYKKRDLEIELAYSVYEKIIFEYLPKLIERALKNYEIRIYIYIVFDNNKENLCGEIADVYFSENSWKFDEFKPIYLGTVNCEELLNYFYQVSNKYNKEHDIIVSARSPFHYCISAPTMDFIKFYYEELQREQYFSKMTRKLDLKQK